MIHAVCSSKSKTEFISSDKVDPGDHMSTELKLLVTATKDANTSIVHRQNLRSCHISQVIHEAATINIDNNTILRFPSFRM